jgi:hypothetical protein
LKGELKVFVGYMTSRVEGETMFVR